MSPDVDVTVPGSPGYGSPPGRPFRPGELVAGRFRVVREIAEGGMGVVYEVVDEKLGERRALKCAKPGYAGTLSPEARTSLRVTHPNVCRAFEIHTVDTRFGPIDFLTMEFIDGGTLSSELRARGRLPEPEARRIAQQICAGVEAAHAQALLHRDLKSDNVLLTKESQGRTRAVVTDFGIAQDSSSRDPAPEASGVAGTAGYLAPERWRGARASVATDIYALGVLLHEVATGHRPGIGSAGERTLAKDVPRRWRPVIARCLESDPDRRYRSVADVADALSDRRARRRAIAWTTAAAIPLAFILWRLLLPTPLTTRLAILPLEAINVDPDTAALLRGASSDLSSRLMRLRPRPPELVIIPVEETRGIQGSNISQAKDRLGATHVLRATVTRLNDRLRLNGEIVDTATKVTVAQRSAEYPINDAGAVTSALSALVASAFQLPSQHAPEQIAPAAYASYAEGIALLQSVPLHAQAIAAFERAMAIDPQAMPRARFNAWTATGDAKWLTRGRDELARAERLNSDSIAVHLAAGRFNFVPGAYDRAAREYERATRLDPTSAEAWSGLARSYMEMHDRDGDAAAAFVKAIELQPGYFRPLNYFGEFYRRLGNYAEAEKQWLQVIAVAPDQYEGHANLGGLYSDLGRYADAERELRRALEIDPRSRISLNNLGSLYQYMDRDAEAVMFFEQARTIGPETHFGMLNLGDSYRRLGQQDQAAAAYRRAREIAETILLKNPRDAATRAFVAYFALRLGDRATAERELTQALNSGGDNRTVIRRAAICYETMGDRERTLAVLQSAPPDLLRELSRQPDLASLRTDPRFVALLPKQTAG